MGKNKKMQVQGSEITFLQIDQQDYISLTDSAKHKSDDSSANIGYWMHNRNMIEFLGVWETLYNPDFKPLEFEGFKKQAGLNAFNLLSQKWVNATEADLLNMALFGITAKQWRESNPNKDGNIRDYSNVSQLVCLANLETINAHFIQQSLTQSERLILLNNTAIQQMRLLTKDKGIKKLVEGKS